MKCLKIENRIQNNLFLANNIIVFSQKFLRKKRNLSVNDGFYKKTLELSCRFSVRKGKYITY